jgi:nitrite reductase (NO-forming)
VSQLITPPRGEAEPQPSTEAVVEPQPSTPVEPSATHNGATGALVGGRGAAPSAAVSGQTAWATVVQTWQRIPPRGRAIVVQVAITLATLLIVLPPAVALGWIGARSAAPSTTPSSTIKPVAPPAHQTYNAQAPAAPKGDTVNVNLTAKEVRLAIAPGVAYDAWTFNGSVPGPIIRVRQGQTVHFTLTNDTLMPHSIDFHAAQTPWNVNYQPVAPGKSFSFDWRANYPGVFMYHCGTPPVMVHMANGMYGAIIVDPAGGWPAAREYVLVQSEFYTHLNPNGVYGIDGPKMMDGMPDYVVFNGYANQYKETPLAARPGEKIRLFIVNAGPSRFSAFHVIGAVFSDVYADGNPANHMVGNQTITIPPGGGAVVEMTIPDAGSYPFVTHAFMDASMGATGVIKVAP